MTKDNASPLPNTFRFLGVLGLAYVLSQFLRSSNAVIAPELVLDLGLDASELGALTGAYFLSFALVQLPVGILLDRFGPRRVMSSMMLMAVLGSYVFSISNDLAGFTMARALMGLGCASILMGGFVVFARWYPKSRFSMFAGAMLGIGNMGLLVSTFPLAWTVERFGWRTSFEWTSLAALVLAAAVYFILRDNPPGQAARSSDENLLESVKGFGVILAERRLWTLYPLMFVGYASVASISMLWAGPYLADVHGLDVISRGEILFLMGCGSVAGAFFYAPLDRLFNTRKGVVIGGALTALTVLLLLATQGEGSLVLTTAAFAMLALATGYVTVLTAHSRSLYPDHMVGRGVSLGNMMNMMGVAVVQLLSGVVMDFVSGLGLDVATRYGVVFVFLAALLAVTLTVYSRSKDIRPDEV